MFVEVLLEHVDARADACGDLLGAVVETVTDHVLVLLEVRQQLAVAASEIQHPRSRGDEVRDDAQVRPH